MAFRMQTSVPELTDISKEPKEISTCTARRQQARHLRLQLPAGPPPGRARSALRPALPHGLGPPRQSAQSHPRQCRDTDQPTAALIQDLKQRGMLDDTLVVWGGEFGRTVYSQGELTPNNYGRDHHPRCFTIWMAGAGIKPGMTRRNRRLRLQHHRRPRPRPRPPRHHPAPHGHRPHPTDLQIPRPRLPPDRRPRKSR